MIPVTQHILIFKDFRFIIFEFTVVLGLTANKQAYKHTSKQTNKQANKQMNK